MTEPIPMVLHCPACGVQHIDRDERPPHARIGLPSTATRAIDWRTWPHRSHLCADCGFIWRPADVPTVGVATIATRGKNDGDLAAMRAELQRFGG